MAQYKVPQDVEADDKLIGPFSFRQFVYIMIAGGLIIACFFLWQVFPLLIIIPIPIIIFLGILALPIKKDQPMETYLSAVVDFYTKPQKRYWMPGQVESTITITAPKQTEEDRTDNLSQEEVVRRLSFLANIVDTEGRAINDNNLRDDIAAEANEATDIFETNQTYNLDRNLQQSTENHHRQVVEQMRNAINQTSIYGAAPAPVQTPAQPAQPIQPAQPVQPVQPQMPTPVMPAPVVQAAPTPTISHAIQTPLSTPVAVTPTPAPSPATPNIAPPNMESSVVIQPDLEEIKAAVTAPQPPEETSNAITEDTQLEAPEPTPIPETPEPEPEPEPIAPAEIEVPNEDESKPIEEDNQEVYISLH